MPVDAPGSRCTPLWRTPASWSPPESTQSRTASGCTKPPSRHGAPRDGMDDDNRRPARPSAIAHLTPQRRHQLEEGRRRVAELLPLAARLGVLVLAGTDVYGSIPKEVALLAQMRLKPKDALAAASSCPASSSAPQPPPTSSPTTTNPREDPEQLANPAAIVIAGTRLR